MPCSQVRTAVYNIFEEAGLKELETLELEEPAPLYHEYCLGRAEAPRVGLHKTLDKLRKFMNLYVFGPGGNLVGLARDLL